MALSYPCGASSHFHGPWLERGTWHHAPGSVRASTGHAVGRSVPRGSSSHQQARSAERELATADATADATVKAIGRELRRGGSWDTVCSKSRAYVVACPISGHVSSSLAPAGMGRGSGRIRGSGMGMTAGDHPGGPCEWSGHPNPARGPCDACWRPPPDDPLPCATAAGAWVTSSRAKPGIPAHPDPHGALWQP